MRQKLLVLAVAAGWLSPSSSVSAFTVETSNFISSPTYFNGFENITSSPNYNPGYFYPVNTGYSEGGITVEEVGVGDGFGYVPILNASSFGEQGNYAWAVNDEAGYTQITLTNGGSFQSIQLQASSYSGHATYVEFELLENSSVVFSGTVANNGYCCGVSAYLGFSGGGFDEVLLQDQISGTSFSSFDPTSTNVMAIDSIAATAATPLPAAFPLFATGLGALALLGWRRKRTARSVAA